MMKGLGAFMIVFCPSSDLFIRLFFLSFFSSPEPLGSQGELIGWP